MDYKQIELRIPLPSDGLSPGDVVRMRGLMHDVLVAVANKIDAATDWDCAPGVRHAIAAGLRGDDALRRDT